MNFIKNGTLYSYTFYLYACHSNELCNYDPNILRKKRKGGGGGCNLHGMMRWTIFILCYKLLKKYSFLFSPFSCVFSFLSLSLSFFYMFLVLGLFFTLWIFISLSFFSASFLSFSPLSFSLSLSLAFSANGCIFASCLLVVYDDHCKSWVHITHITKYAFDREIAWTTTLAAAEMQKLGNEHKRFLLLFVLKLIDVCCAYMVHISHIFIHTSNYHMKNCLCRNS